MPYKLFSHVKCCRGCPEPVEAAFSDTARDDGTYRFKYYCKAHSLERGRLNRQWEILSYEVITNEHGMPYYKSKPHMQPLEDYVAQRESEQITLFL